MRLILQGFLEAGVGPKVGAFILLSLDVHMVLLSALSVAAYLSYFSCRRIFDSFAQTFVRQCHHWASVTYHFASRPLSLTAWVGIVKNVVKPIKTRV